MAQHRAQATDCSNCAWSERVSACAAQGNSRKLLASCTPAIRLGRLNQTNASFVSCPRCAYLVGVILVAQMQLEVVPQSKLTGSISRVLCSGCSYQLAEVAIVDLRSRRCEVGVIEDVCKATLKTKVGSFGDLEHLCDAEGDCLCSRSLQDSDASVSKTASVGWCRLERS
jgi:hypothetical protein